MNRRDFLKWSAVVPVLPVGCTRAPRTTSDEQSLRTAMRRVRPGEPGWPAPQEWAALDKSVGGRLVKFDSPLAPCRDAPDGEACREFFTRLKNPYAIRDDPALTQTCGWVGAWMAAPSAYAVQAERTADVVAAVNFAREHHLRLVVKGGGHSYQGTSNCADSLLVWTRGMRDITMHDAFVGRGCDGKQPPQTAVSVGAGAVWAEAYDAVTTRGGRYVQGGGCMTVGVAGLVQSGGFGPFSKRYGSAAAALLEAEVVTADGALQIANACSHPDLFWGLKGGGGGSLGVVTRVTLRTRDLPQWFGGVFGAIRAKSDPVYRDLAARVIRFYAERLFNPTWGEQIVFRPGRRVTFSMVFQGLDKRQAQDVWRPFIDAVTASAAAGELDVEEPVTVVDVPAQHLWNTAALRQAAPALIAADDRPGAPEGNIFWASNRDEAGWVLHGYRSAWLPATLLRSGEQPRLVDALIGASRHRAVALHCNKGLAGAPKEELESAADTATNPAVLSAFALAIIAAAGPPAFPGVKGREPDAGAARRDAKQVNDAMDALLKVVPDAGSYVSESDYFERSWQRSFWGENYPRLAAVKQKYDPGGLFFVHHGVGSEGWSADGFVRS